MAQRGIVTWMVDLQTLNPLLHLPRATNVVAEVQDSPVYFNDCRLRARESHCIFKYTLAGEGIIRDGKGEHRVPAGTGFLVRINNPEVSYYYPPEAREPWSFVYLAFTGPAGQVLVDELVQRYGPVYALPEENPALRRILAYRTQKTRKVELSPEESAGMVLNLLLELTAAEERKRRDDPGNVLVRAAQEVVAANLEGWLNVSELARELRVSREHLTRVFRQTLHQTPHDYLLRQKVLYACQQLKDTDLTVKELAARLGYQTPSHFVRSFKTVVGLTPAVFRTSGHMPVL